MIPVLICSPHRLAVVSASLVAIALHLATLPGVALAQMSSPSLAAAMQEGGTVIFLRHAETNQFEVDRGRLGDRAGQRNLSPDGIRQAEELGRAFRRLAIPLHQILASPVFRARDTAELAFGAERIEVTIALVADDYAGGQVGAMVESSRRLISTPPPPGTNILLVGHRTPLQMVTQRDFPDSILPEGALAVFVPRGGQGELLGTLSADEFVAASEVGQ